MAIRVLPNQIQLVVNIAVKAVFYWRNLAVEKFSGKGLREKMDVEDIQSADKA